MDTIQIANQSLQIVNDSVFVLLPDSIHTFQTKAADNFSHKELYQILISIGTSVFVAILAFLLVWYREKNKENIRIAKVQAHIFSWLSIIKINLISQASDCSRYSYKHLLSNNKYSEPFIFFSFPFQEILDIDKVDLSEIILRNNKENVFTLFQLKSISDNVQRLKSSLNSDIEKIESDFESLKFSFKNYSNELRKSLKQSEYSLQIINNAEHFLLKEFEGYSIKKDLEGVFEWLRFRSYSTDRMEISVDENTFKNLVKDYKIIIEAILQKVDEQENIFTSLEKKFLVEAAHISLILEYFNNKITYKDFMEKYKDVNEYDVHDLNLYSEVNQTNYLMV